MKQNVLFSDINIIGKNFGKYLERFKNLLKLDSTVLITGETGTGKELIARWIHFMDEIRKDRPFVKITIPNIGENIFESEVFGYEKGAFTGAITAKKGLIEVAENGTVFLDEIENASPSIQSKLLQLLEDRIYRKVGGTEYLCTEARFIVATNVELFKLVEENKFRSDLYYRLAVVDLNLPPLIERGGDIIEISNFYIKKFNEKFLKNVNFIDESMLKHMLSYKWPGNIRELRNFIEKRMVFEESNNLDLSMTVSKQKDIGLLNYKEYISIKEKEFFEDVYKKANGKADEMAELMKMSVPFVYKKLKEHEIM